MKNAATGALAAPDNESIAAPSWPGLPTTPHAAEATKHGLARFAGFMLWFSLVAPMLLWVLVLSRIVVASDAAATVQRMAAHLDLLRVGVAHETVLCIGSTVLGASFYALLEPINPKLALLAYCWKLVEAVFVGVIALSTFVVLRMLESSAQLALPERALTYALIGRFFDAHMAMWSIAMVFLGLSSATFFYLFLGSRYLPRSLALFGIVAYALISIRSFVDVLWPTWAAMPIMGAIFYTPSVLAEIVIGSWLSLRGSRTARPG